MNHPDPTTAPPSSANEIETVAQQIAVTAREMSSEIDDDRRLPEELVALLGDSGLLRAGAPAEVRALELPPGVALRCAEAVARGNASAGWCVSIAITSSLLVAYLPASSRDALFGEGRGVAAGVWAPRGTARTVDGGVVVSGRWSFCSGINHADMMFAGCLVDDQRVPSVVALRKEDLQVLDTWHTLGLRGTGSHDSVADEVLVPADRVFSLFDGPILDRPLYRFPVFGFFALSIAAAALGNARAAIDDLIELAGAKKGVGSTRTLAERSSTQAVVATAESSLSAARALYYQAIETAWQAASQGGAGMSVEARNRLRLAATHAVRTSADVVRDMYDLAGGGAIYDSSPLQRRFRDAYTATAHFQVNEASRELPGRILLDQPADVAML
jgi:alkylation response protein AidB-like acyl-CoA dehydrogenase